MNRLNYKFAQYAVLVGLLWVIGGTSLSYPFGRDQAEYAELAVINSDIPNAYCRFINVKPPGTHLVHQVAHLFFGRTMGAIRIVDLVVQLLIGFLITGICRQLLRNRWLGPAAAAVYWISYFSLDFWGTAQTESFQMLPVMAALYLFATGGRVGVVRAAACGLLIGIAVLFKYQIGILAPLLALALIWKEAPNWRKPLTGAPAGALLTCSVLPLSAHVVHLWSQGCALEVVTFAANYYTTYLHGPPQTFIVPDTVLAREQMVLLTILLGTAGLCFPFLPALRLSRGSLAIAAFAVAASLQVLAAQKFYDYHFIPMLLAAPLTIPALFQICAAKNPMRAHSAAFIGLVLFGLQFAGIWYRLSHATEQYFSTVQDLPAYHRSRLFGEYGAGKDFSSAATLEVADFLKEQEGDCSLFVWGFEPGLYYNSGCRPATRAIYNFPYFRAYRHLGVRDTLVSELSESLPRFFVVLRNDELPWVTGSTHDSFWELKVNFPELRRFLDEHYDLRTTIEDFLVFERSTAMHDVRSVASLQHEESGT